MADTVEIDAYTEHGRDLLHSKLRLSLERDIVIVNCSASPLPATGDKIAFAVSLSDLETALSWLLGANSDRD